jgi:hypothetical protein
MKILALILLMITCFLVTLALSVAVSIPFFGTGLLDGAGAFSDYTDPRTVAMLKYLQIFNQFGIFILPAVLFVALTDDNFRGYLRIDGEFRRFSLVFGFILLIVSLPFIGWLLDVNGRLHLPESLSRIESWMRTSEDNAEKLTEAFLSTSSWTGFLVNLLMIAVIAAIGEELIFRGILVRLFDEWSGNIHLAVFIPAFLFSALHLQFYGFFGRLLLGMILGYLFVWSGSLWVPIIVHFFNNAMAVVISFMDQRGLISIDLESFGTSRNPVVVGGSFLMMLFILWIIYIHERGNIGRLAKKRP